jgi:hypothetical protein
LQTSGKCLVGLAHATLYYELTLETAENLKLIRLIDEQYTSARSTAAGGSPSGWRPGPRGENRKRV